MSYYTANVRLYQKADGSIGTAGWPLAFVAGDTVPDATVTRDGLATLGLVTLQPGGGSPVPEYPVTVVGAPTSGQIPAWNASTNQWEPGASPSGTYLPGGAGSKREVDFAAKYSADPTGATDVTALLGTALSDLDTAGGGTLRLNGHFKYDTIDHTATNPLAVVGTPGSRLVSTSGKFTATPTFRLVGPTDIRVMHLDFRFTTAVVVDSDAGSRTLAHTVLIGGDSSGSRATRVVVEDVTVYDSRNTPVYVQYADDVTVDGYRTKRALANGLAFVDCTSIFLDHYNVEDSGDDGIVVSSDTTGQPSGSTWVGIGKGRIYKTYGSGIDLVGAVAGVIDGPVIEKTWYPGIFVFSDSTDGLNPNSDIVIDHYVIRDAGQYYGAGQFKTTVSPNPNGIHITGANTGVVIGSTGRIVNAHGLDIHAESGADGYPDVRVDTPSVKRAGVTGLFLRPDCPDLDLQTPALDTACWTPIVIPGNRIDTVTAQVFTAGAAGSRIRLGIAADLNGQPGHLLYDSGQLNSESTGLKTASPALTVQPGVYWFGYVAQGGTAPVMWVCKGHVVGMPTNQAVANVSGYQVNSVSGAFSDPVGNSGYTTVAPALTVGL